MIRRTIAAAVITAATLTAPAMGQVQYREGAAHVSGHYGGMCLAVRSDAGGAFAPDGGYAPLSVDANNLLRVVAAQSGAPWLVAGSGTFTVGDGSGPLTVDGTLTCNAGSGTFAVSAAALPLPTGAATEATLATRASETTLGTRLADSTFTGRTPAGASPADNESNTNTALSRVGAFNFVFDGTTWDRWTGSVTLGAALPAGTNNIGDVDVLTLPALPAGTNNIGDVDVLTLPALPAGTNNIGDVDVLTFPDNEPFNFAQVGGTTVSTALGVADAGTIRVSQSQEATYSAGTTAKTATAAGTGPFFTICGSGTKTLRIQRFTVSGTVATAAVYGDIVLKRTSTATSAGTATALTKLPYDSNSAASTANAVNFYTVLATAGTSQGVVITATQFFPITGTAALMPPPLIFLWRDIDSESPTLRGTAQCLEASFGTTTTNAPTLSVSVAWTEK